MDARYKLYPYPIGGKVYIIEKKHVKFNPRTMRSEVDDANGNKFIDGTLVKKETINTGDYNGRTVQQKYTVQLDDGTEKVFQENAYYFKHVMPTNISGGRRKTKKNKSKKRKTRKTRTRKH